MSEHLKGEQWLASRQRRAFDIAAATSVIPALAPVVFMGALAFAAETRIHPLFLQQRVGRAGEPFTIAKLRTMPFVEDQANASTGYGDERATRVGRFLRKYTIDEIPQWGQVLAGQMSVVGPRPLVPSEVAETLDLLSPSEKNDWIHARTVAKPGFLSDFGNLTRTLDADVGNWLLARVEADCVYADTASAETDIRIIRESLKIGAKVIQAANTVDGVRVIPDTE